MLGRRPLSWECEAGEIAAFKRDVILRHIVDEEARSFPFVQYLHNRRVFADRDVAAKGEQPLGRQPSILAHRYLLAGVVGKKISAPHVHTVEAASRAGHGA